MALPNYDPFGNDDVSVDDAADVFNEKLEQLDSLLENTNAVSNFNEAMDSLREVFSDKATPPTADVSYDFVEGDDLSLDLGDPPEDPVFDTNINIPDDPHLRGSIMTPSFDEVGEFNDTLDDPPPITMDFNEDVFESLIWDDLQNIARSVLNAGGTGLDESVEDAIWDRARDRNRLQDEQEYREAEDYFASRGYNLPPGVLAAQLAQVRAEQSKRDDNLSNEIAIKQAELAQTNDQFIKQLSLDISKADMDFHNAVQNRALERAVSIANVFRDMYRMKVDGYIGKVNAYRARVDAARSKIDATSSYNKSITDTFIAETEAQRAKISSELALVELVAKKYTTRMAGYEAKSRAASTELSAKIEKYKAEVQQSVNQTELSLKEAEYLLQVYLKGLELDESLSSDNARLWSNFLVSIMTAVNVSASMSDSSSISRNKTREDGYGGTEHPNASVSLSGSYGDL